MANRDPFKDGKFNKSNHNNHGTLENIIKNKTFHKQVDKADAPFQRNKEKTKSVQVREHTYKILKRLALDRNETLVDIVNHITEKWLSQQPEVKEMKAVQHFKKKLKAKYHKNKKNN